MMPGAMGITVRDAAWGDLRAINGIYNEHVLSGTGTFDLQSVTAEAREAWFRAHGERYPVLVAESGGEVIGWGSLSPFHTRPAYRFTVEDSVYVRADLVRHGAGTGLLAALLARAEDLGYHTVMAVIGDSANEASVGLHRRLGFVHIGIEREVGYKFDRWLDVVLMQWTAPPAR